jgi:hypothetical protein
VSDFQELMDAFDVRGYLEERGRLRNSGPTNVVCRPCPICGDNRGKFYANVRAGRHNGMWNAYCHHDQGNLVDLVMHVEGVTREEAVSQIRARVEGTDNRIIPIIEKIAETALPSSQELVQCVFPAPLRQASPYDAIASQGSLIALDCRGVTSTVIERHALQVTGEGTYLGTDRRHDLDHRLIIPIRQGDRWLSWQARDLTGKASRKYVFPAGDRSSEWFYDFDDYLEHGGSTVLVVEGVFHKWAWDNLGATMGNLGVSHLSVASFGKRMTAEQERLLMTTPKIKRIIIGWDLDAWPEIVKVAGRIAGRKELLIMPAHESGMDHDELPHAELKRMLVEARPYSLDFALEQRLLAYRAGT